MQFKKGINNVTENTPINPLTGFAEVGIESQTLQLKLDAYGKVVLAESVDINIEQSQVVGLSDALDSIDQNPSASILGRLMFKGDGGLIYDGHGRLLLKGAP